MLEKAFLYQNCVLAGFDINKVYKANQTKLLNISSTRKLLLPLMSLSHPVYY